MLNSHIQKKDPIKEELQKRDELLTSKKKELREGETQEQQDLRRVIWKTKKPRKEESSRLRYNEIIKEQQRITEDLDYNHSKKTLLILEKLLSTLNYLEEGGAIG